MAKKFKRNFRISYQERIFMNRDSMKMSLCQCETEIYNKTTFVVMTKDYNIMRQQRFNYTKLRIAGKQLPKLGDCQQQYIYKWLLTSTLTTQQGCDELEVMHSVVRIQELKGRGHNIRTRLRSIETSTDVYLDVAGYSLVED